MARRGRRHRSDYAVSELPVTLHDVQTDSTGQLTELWLDAEHLWFLGTTRGNSSVITANGM